MGSRVAHTKNASKIARGIFGLLLFSVALSALIGGYSYATDTTINVGVTGSPAPLLEITNLSGPVTVTSMPLTVVGQVDNLTQIQVYVDGAYSSTIPLAVTAQSFSYQLTLEPGDHTVQFTGISAYTSTNPTVSLTVSYQPPAIPPVNPPTSPPPGGSGTTSGGQPSTGGVVVGGAPLGNSTTSGPAGVTLPNWLYQPLVFLDLINPTEPLDTGTMVGRFLLLLLALFLIVFARPVLWLYRKVRYDLLRLNKRPLTYILRRYPLFWIRLLGVVIAAIVFIYM